MGGISDSWGERGNSDECLSPPTSTLTSKVESLALSQPGPATCAPVELDWLAPPQQPGEMGRLGPYRVLGILGSGGMGIVFRAEDTQLQRPVALKALLPSRSDMGLARLRFLREGRAAAAIKHDHVITIYQVGEDGGVPFLAMELLTGESLEDRLARQGRLPVADVLRIGRETALGLSAAHAQDMIHRDIKPANIWLEGEAGRVKILDFGLARVGGEVQLTRTGIVVGTPAYMSPEQAAGKDVDARCDLFSLGAVLYRLVTGELPFKGDDPLGLLIAIGNDVPVPPWEINPAVPEPLSELILRLLAKDRRYRPVSAKAVIDALESIEPDSASIGLTEDTDPLLQAVEGAQSPETVVTPCEQPPRRRKSSLAVGLFIAVFVLTLTAGWLLLRDAAGLAKNKVPACLDDLRLKDVPAPLLRAAGNGNPDKAPEGLVAVWPVAEPKTPVTALAFSPDGKLLACGTSKGRVRLLAVPTGERVGLFSAHTRMIQQIAFHRDGELLATSANDGQVRLWSIDGLARTESFPAADGDSRPMAFSFDGKMLATGSRGEKGGCLQLHPMMPGTPTPPELRDSQFGVAALAFSSAGLLAAGDADRKTIRFWDPSTGTALYSVSPLPGETASSLAFSPDGTQLAGTFVSTNSVRVWSAATGEQLRLLESTPRLHKGRSRQQVAIGPDNRTLAAVTGTGVICLWDLSTDKPAKVIRVSPAVSQVEQIAFSPDGRHLATANNNGTVYILRLGDSSKQ
jgi:WD40 repeat protein/tRNA A-37 threonylcarbamoyl transferase component Bud32